ncbi:MAG: DegQ family serine endoprotease [Pseudomonadota bacterium]
MIGSASAALPVVDSQGAMLPSLAPMLDEVTPGVVNIATRGRVAIQNPMLNDPLFRRFFPNLPSQRPTQSLGSGVIVDAAKGYVLTNGHVIANADEITVTMRDGRTFNAQVKGADPETDVAVIQIPAQELTAVPLGTSSDLRVGDFVVAVGNPFGLGQTVTSGIVSAVGRTGLGIEGYEDFIQTDASINPGNSGGALVNLRGQLVGINTAILSPAGGNIGIGFAIPIDMAREIMAQLIEFGEVRRGRLGMQLQTLTPELARALNLKFDPARPGVVVAQVEPGAPADKAGIKPGDVVTAVDGQPVRGVGSLRNVIGLMRVGEKVKLELLRNGERIDAEMVIAAQEDMAGVRSRHEDPRLAGVTFGALDPNSALRGSVDGIPVLNVEPDSPAGRAGLQAGDMVVSINRRPVRTPDDLVDAIQRPGPLLFNVRRDDSSLFIVIEK